jgi:DNA-binding NtrC family response regulator
MPPRPGPLLDPDQLIFLENVAALLSTNPFVPAWVDRVQACLGDRYRPGLPVWCSRNAEIDDNHRLIGERLAELLPKVRNRLRDGFPATGRERAIYVNAAILALYGNFAGALARIVAENAVKVPFWGQFEKGYTALLAIEGLDAPPAADLLALFYQMYRAWYFPWKLIPGAAPATARARAQILEACVGKDVAAYYRQGLWRTMAEQPVLITGETGTGKELAARCIAGGRFIAFDVQTRRFAAAPLSGLHVVNLSEASSSLFESQLCGHVRGAFTGASEDAPGYLGLAAKGETLVLDEFGEITNDMQVKLLRPVENKVYRRVGERETRLVEARILLSTNRDLGAMVRRGKFREDLYTRVNVLRVVMPPLRRILREAPDERLYYVKGFVAEMLPQSPETWDALAYKIDAGIARHRAGETWRGNLRALRNHVRQALLSSGVVPDGTDRQPDTGQEPGSVATSSDRRAPSSRRRQESDRPEEASLLAPDALSRGLSLDDWNRYIVTSTFAMCGRNKSETARRLGVDWRTVDKWIDYALLERETKRPPR